MEPAASDLRIAIATTSAEREQIYRFRYEVYVARLARRARGADHVRRALHEDLDDDS